jgi:acyl dehydratase
VNVSEQASFDTSRIGVPVVSGPIEITEEAVRRFGAATNDEDPQVAAGRVASPLYALVPVLKTMVAAKKAVTPAFGVHGEHDLHVREPLVPGMVVQVTARVVGVRQRSAGVAIVVQIETRAGDGRLVNEQYFTSFVSGGHVAEPAGEDAPAHVPPPPADAAAAHEVTQVVDPDQTQRFAAAADDWDAYTLDEQVARSMGFPTVIVHGTCTMAFAARAIVATACDGDSTRLRRFAARLSSPLLLVPGQRLTTRAWPVPDGLASRVLGFESFDKEGTRMIKNGLAEVTA